MGAGKLRHVVVGLSETSVSGYVYRESFELNHEVVPNIGEHVGFGGVFYKVLEVLHLPASSIGPMYPVLLVQEIRKHRLIPEGLPENLRVLFP